MTKPMVRIHNTETDEVIDREMTAAELKDYEADQTARTVQIAETAAAATAKADLLSRLGITTQEATLLLG
jgi:hypothetical protein